MYSRLCISLFLPYFIRINLSYTFSSHRVFWYRLLRGVFDDSAMLLPTWKFLFWLHTFFKTKNILLLKSTKSTGFFCYVFLWRKYLICKTIIIPQSHHTYYLLYSLLFAYLLIGNKIIGIAQGAHLHLGPSFRKWVSFSVLFASWLGCFFVCC